MLKDEFCTPSGFGCVILRGELGEWELLRSQRETAACEWRETVVVASILSQEREGGFMKNGAAPPRGAAPFWVFVCGGWLSWIVANFRLSFVSSA